MHTLAVIQEQEEYWNLGIGDPTLIGWLTVAAYLVASFLCIYCALRVSRFPFFSQSVQLPWLWWSLAIILLLLGLNKQLDIQSWFRITGKEVIKTQGWYQHRMTIYMGVATILFTSILTILVFLGRAIQSLWQKYWLILFGIVLLSSYILATGSSNVSCCLRHTKLATVSASIYLDFRNRRYCLYWIFSNE